MKYNKLDTTEIQAQHKIHSHSNEYNMYLTLFRMPYFDFILVFF